MPEPTFSHGLGDSSVLPSSRSSSPAGGLATYRRTDSVCEGAHAMSTAAFDRRRGDTNPLPELGSKRPTLPRPYAIANAPSHQTIFVAEASRSRNVVTFVWSWSRTMRTSSPAVL